MRRSFGLALVFALALAGVACGGSSSASTTAPTAAVPTAGTETFVGQMAPGGAAIRTFIASATGTVSITLSTTDPGGILLGLGIGIPGTNIGSCDMTKTLQTRAGATAQITASVEAGYYCAGAFDIGTVGKAGVVVGLTVAHP
jgi:hypothetical protein